MGGLGHTKKPLFGIGSSSVKGFPPTHFYIFLFIILLLEMIIMTDLKKVVGFYTGEFTTRDTGEKKIYHNLFIVFPREGATGIGAEKISVRGQDPFKGIQVGDYVELMYDRYGNCTRIDPVEPNESDLLDFKQCGDVFAMLDN